MWSGPRNVSTALMRSWGNREDTVVIDEPLYAHYLAVTGRAHPGREQVIAHHETDWRRVVEMLLGPQPPGTRIFYQKQMSHHLLPDIGREWLSRVTNAFLIRDPRAMLASLAEKLEEFTLADTGLAAAGRDLRSRAGDDRARAPGRGLGGSARGTRARAAAALRGARRAVQRADARLAARPARHRRDLGAMVVRARRGVDRLRDTTRETARKTAAGA